MWRSSLVKNSIKNSTPTSTPALYTSSKISDSAASCLSFDLVEVTYPRHLQKAIAFVALKKAKVKREPDRLLLLQPKIR